MKLLAAIVACLVGHAGLVAQDTDPGQADDTFVTKELGDHTSRLRDRLRVGQEVSELKPRNVTLLGHHLQFL